MKVLRWGVSAVAALLLAGGSSFANDAEELSAMKATMDNMKQEMNAMRATMSAEREAMRQSAGCDSSCSGSTCSAESLLSANKKATIKIGGEFKLRYTIGWASNYNTFNEAGTATNVSGGTNRRFTYAAWDINKALLAFDIEFTPDTSAFIGLRLDRGNAGVGGILDEMWWNWNNVGGTGLGLKAGYQTLDFGMFNGSQNPWSRALLLDPYVKDQSSSNFTGASAANIAEHEPDITATGVTASYKLFDEQVSLAAGIFAAGAGNGGAEGYLGLTNSGDSRNLEFVNHFVTMYYDPCWLENLHMQASYMGRVDEGQGNGTNTYNPATYNTWDGRVVAGSVVGYNGGYEGGTNYQPSFDFGISYIADKWAVYGEFFLVGAPGFSDNSLEYTMSFGGDYAVTEKLKVGAGFDLYYAYASYQFGFVNGQGEHNYYGYGMRGRLAAKYDFGNGIYVGAEYSHAWQKTWGLGDDRSKDADMITFQTGFKF